MRPQRTFRSKFIAVTGISIVVGLIANLWVASNSLKALGEESSNEIEKGLRTVSQEYLTNYIEDAAARTDLTFRLVKSELKIFADIVQGILDRKSDLAPVFAALENVAFLRHELTYSQEGHFYQNAPDKDVVVNVLGGSLNPDASIPEPIRVRIHQTALLDLLMPPFLRNGTEKQKIYYVGSDDAAITRMFPYYDLGSESDKHDPSGKKLHRTVPFWGAFFPNLTTGWNLWQAEDPGRFEEFRDLTKKTEMRQVTVTPPYMDAAGGGVVMSMFHPLWSVERTQLAGAVGVDLTLDRVIKDIESVSLGGSGFAFLARSSGELIAIKPKGAEVLRLQTRAENQQTEGVNTQMHSLKESEDPAVANLQLPQDASVRFTELVIAGERYLLVMKQMGEFATWLPDKKPYIMPDYWTLGFIVPTAEIYRALIASQRAIERSTQVIRMQQFIIMLATLIIVLTGVYWLSQRVTTDLVALSNAASRIMRKDYDVRVSINTQDEVGYLGTAFNEMASEIRSYTKNLESIVEQRTSELKRANEEIQQLNGRLEEENLRLAAEIDVARRLQSMVLPQPEELEKVEGLDIDGYMKPADEVGGDYYDVLQGPNGVKLGMGDVTGHGLESGVLMLMVQTAVRTLLASGERDPVRFLNLVNQAVYLNNQRMAVERNLSLCLLDYKDGLLTITGQHEDVIVIRADGRLECIDTTDLGFPLGLKLDIYDLSSHSQVTLQAGDLVILYTDGITEAENAEGVHYGMERLCDVAMQLRSKSAKEIRKAIIEDVSKHIGEQEVFDDITLLVIKKA